MKEELWRSRKFLQDITGSSVDSIAYPYGNFTTEVIDESRLAGFTRILDGSEYERMTVNPYISVNSQMTAIIKGKYEY